jgi:hypothetical protein
LPAESCDDRHPLRKPTFSFKRLAGARAEMSCLTKIRPLGFDVDFEHLFTFVQQQGSVVRMYYYTDVVASARPLLEWLEHYGIT